MGRRQGELFACLILLTLTLVCFARLVANPSWLVVDGERESVDHAQRDDFRPVGNDLTFFYLPHYLRAADQVATFGRLPHWDSSGFAGRPLVGNPQGGLFYPPLRLAWRARSPAALGWLTVAHLLWAGLGVFVLVRSLGAGVVAATVAAGCYQASPYVLAQVFEGHYPHVWAASWYPWAFWAFEQLRRGHLVRGLTLAPILALALLAGHPQEWYYLIVALSAWGLWEMVRLARARQFQDSARRLGTWLLVLTLSLGLVAVELLPDLAAQAWTLQGSHLSLGKVSRYQVDLLNLVQLLSPSALGGPTDYFGADNYWETIFSIGLVPLILVLIAAARHPERRLIRGWLILIGAAVVFAAGRKLGVFPLLFELIPGMNRFRVASRSLFLANLGAAVLAGFGVETLRLGGFGTEGWKWLWKRFLRIAVVVGAVLIALLPFAPSETATRPVPPTQALSLREIRTILRNSHWEHRQAARAASQVVWSGTFWFAIVGAAGILAIGSRSSAGLQGCSLAFGLLGLVELGAYGYGLIQVAPPSRFLGPDPISHALKQATPPVEGPFRIRARDTLYSDLRALTNGMEKINVNDSFQLQHAADLYESLYALLYVPPVPDPKSMMSVVVARHRQEGRQLILDRMNVAFLVSDHVETDPHWPLVTTGTTLEGSRFSIHYNPTALPRAYVVPRADLLSDGDVASVFARFRAVDPREAVVMPSEPLPAGGARQPFTPAMMNRSDPDRVVIQVTTEAPGLLVVTDTWMPGWYAQDNGRPVRVYRANHAQRVIPLTRSGPHEVILRYESPEFARGRRVTLVSCLVWGMVIVAVSVRAKPGFDARA